MSCRMRRYSRFPPSHLRMLLVLLSSAPVTAPGIAADSDQFPVWRLDARVIGVRDRWAAFTLADLFRAIPISC